ncbi:unnamed protein product [[Actinomadura] parvosata subsp. kistnae]|nr:unnamed protein product [Actinomadura parvosata subsp. kistnae]
MSNSARGVRARAAVVLLPPPEVARHDWVRLWSVHYADGAVGLQGTDAKKAPESNVDSLSAHGS